MIYLDPRIRSPSRLKSRPPGAAQRRRRKENGGHSFSRTGAGATEPFPVGGQVRCAWAGRVVLRESLPRSLEVENRRRIPALACPIAINCNMRRCNPRDPFGGWSGPREGRRLPMPPTRARQRRGAVLGVLGARPRGWQSPVGNTGAAVGHCGGA